MGNIECRLRSGSVRGLRRGTLVYVTGGVAPDQSTELVWVARDGTARSHSHPGSASMVRPVCRQTVTKDRNGHRASVNQTEHASGSTTSHADMLTPLTTQQERVFWGRLVARRHSHRVPDVAGGPVTADREGRRWHRERRSPLQTATTRTDSELVVEGRQDCVRAEHSNNAQRHLGARRFAARTRRASRSRPLRLNVSRRCRLTASGWPTRRTYLAATKCMCSPIQVLGRASRSRRAAG